MSDVRYAVSVDSAGAVKSIETLDSAFKKLTDGQAGTSESSKQLGAETGKTSGIFSALGKQAQALWAQFAAGQFVVDGVRKAFAFLKDTVSDSIKGAIQEEQADHRLTIALQTTGKARNGAVADMIKFAKQQSRVTLYTDDEVKATAALLAQLTHLDAEGIKNIIPGIEGLAAVLGPDEGGLRGATMAVVKAMEGQSMGLRRAGIIIDDTLPKGEKLVEIQRRLTELFPRATEELNTTGGAISQAGKSWDEFKEKLGFVFIESLGLKAMSEALSKVLDEQADEADADTESFLRLAAAQGRFKPGGFGFMFEDYAKTKAARLEAEATAKTFDDFMAGVIESGKPAANAITNLADSFKDLGIKSGKELQSQLTLAKDALAEMNREGGYAPGVMAAVKKKIEEITEALYPGTAAWIAYQQAEENVWKLHTRATAEQTKLPFLPDLSALRGAQDAFTGLGAAVGGGLAAAIDFVEPKASGLFENLTLHANNAKKEVEDLKFSIQDVYAAAGQIISGFNAVTDQAQRNREIAVDNEYKKKLAAINANVKDETARQKAIVALEAEYQIKKTEAQRAGAKASKAVGMMEAMVNTATAVTSALKVFPPWLGIAFASVIGALGAVQIGLIAKQPIPLAKGAVFSKPTLLPATTYQVGDAGPGNPEIIAPKSMIREAVSEALSQLMPQMAFAGAGASVTNNFSGPLIEAHGWSESDLQRGADKLVDAVNKGLRDIGHRTI